jgi:hypothetical protein
MSTLLRIQIAAAIAMSSAAIFGVLYLIAGMPEASNEEFFGAALPVSIAGGIVVAILGKQLLKRLSGRSK